MKVFIPIAALLVVCSVCAQTNKTTKTPATNKPVPTTKTTKVVVVEEKITAEETACMEKFALYSTTMTAWINSAKALSSNALQMDNRITNHFNYSTEAEGAELKKLLDGIQSYAGSHDHAKKQVVENYKLIRKTEDEIFQLAKSPGLRKSFTEFVKMKLLTVFSVQGVLMNELIENFPKLDGHLMNRTHYLIQYFKSRNQGIAFAQGNMSIKTESWYPVFERWNSDNRLNIFQKNSDEIMAGYKELK